MTTKVFKYPLLTAPNQWQVVRLPQGARPLSVQAQNETICLWALVGEACEQALVTHYVFLAETGAVMEEHPLGLAFLGTVQLHGGDYVLHVFMRQR